MDNSLAYAQQLDAADPLAHFRKSFIIPERNGKEQIYFLGNSLGLQNRHTAPAIQSVLSQWSEWGVEAFFMGENPWMHFHDQLTGPLAAITGALQSELVVMNQLTVNLHLMMASFYRPTSKRRKILCEAGAFPSDQYMLESHLKFLGADLAVDLIELGPRKGEHTINTEDIISTIEKHADELALVMWGGVNYYTGQVFDMDAITVAAKNAGSMVGFDLAHGVGNIKLELHTWGVDFACWCNYKYLNGGPGAIGAAFIHERYHKDETLNRLAGWWGYEKSTRFKMAKGFVPVYTAEGWQLSTPSPIQYACLHASLSIFEEAGFDQLLTKGRKMNDYLHALLDTLNQPGEALAIEIITPRAAGSRGNQVSLLMHKNGKQIFDALQAEGIFADWREPNVIRVAPVPLYNSFVEVWQFTDALKRLLNQV